MKVLSDVRSILMKEVRKLEQEKASYDERIYRLTRTIEAIQSTEDLKRINTVKGTKTCKICKKEFRVFRKGSNICRSRKCRVSLSKSIRNGVVLIAGEKK